MIPNRPEVSDEATFTVYLRDPFLEAKDEAVGSGACELFASSYGNLDTGGDVILPGAFERTLEQQMRLPLRNGKQSTLKLYGRHLAYGADIRDVLGTFVEARDMMHESVMRLWMKAIFSSAMTAQDARVKVRERHINGASIDYSVPKGGSSLISQDDGSVIREIKEVRLFGVTLTTIPMNELAEVIVGKSRYRVPHVLEVLRAAKEDRGQVLAAMFGSPEARKSYAEESAWLIKSLSSVETLGKVETLGDTPAGPPARSLALLQMRQGIEARRQALALALARQG